MTPGSRPACEGGVVRLGPNFQDLDSVMVRRCTSVRHTMIQTPSSRSPPLCVWGGWGLPQTKWAGLSCALVGSPSSSRCCVLAAVPARLGSVGSPPSWTEGPQPDQLPTPPAPPGELVGPPCPGLGSAVDPVPGSALHSTCWKGESRGALKHRA